MARSGTDRGRSAAEPAGSFVRDYAELRLGAERVVRHLDPLRRARGHFGTSMIFACGRGASGA